MKHAIKRRLTATPHRSGDGQKSDAPSAERGQKTADA